jgi:hypothetical protein
MRNKDNQLQKFRKETGKFYESNSSSRKGSKLEKSAEIPGNSPRTSGTKLAIQALLTTATLASFIAGSEAAEANEGLTKNQNENNSKFPKPWSKEEDFISNPNSQTKQNIFPKVTTTEKQRIGIDLSNKIVDVIWDYPTDKTQLENLLVILEKEGKLNSHLATQKPIWIGSDKIPKSPEYEHIHTPLHYAINQAKPEAVSLILKKNPDLTIKEDQTSKPQTPMEAAITSFASFQSSPEKRKIVEILTLHIIKTLEQESDSERAEKLITELKKVQNYELKAQRIISFRASFHEKFPHEEQDYKEPGDFFNEIKTQIGNFLKKKEEKLQKEQPKKEKNRETLTRKIPSTSAQKPRTTSANRLKPKERNWRDL